MRQIPPKTDKRAWASIKKRLCEARSDLTLELRREVSDWTFDPLQQALIGYRAARKEYVALRLHTGDYAHGVFFDWLSYPPIPKARLFWTGYAWALPKVVHYWEWSDTFGCWGACVTFAGGQRLYTYPRPRKG